MMSLLNPLGTGDYDLKMNEIDRQLTYFRIQTTIPSKRGALTIILSNLEGNQLP